MCSSLFSRARTFWQLLLHVTNGEGAASPAILFLFCILSFSFNSHNITGAFGHKVPGTVLTLHQYFLFELQPVLRAARGPLVASDSYSSPVLTRRTIGGAATFHRSHRPFPLNCLILPLDHDQIANSIDGFVDNDTAASTLSRSSHIFQ